MDYGSWMDFYSGIFGLVLFRGLSFFYGLIPSYGVAILLVTLTLKIIFWPIQAKSMASMKQMQKFQPQVAKLKEKYKDDAARLNQETMKLYKEHKINPFARLPADVRAAPGADGVLQSARQRYRHPRGVVPMDQRPRAADTILTVAGFGINPLPLVMSAR